MSGWPQSRAPLIAPLSRSATEPGKELLTWQGNLHGTLLDWQAHVSVLLFGSSSGTQGGGAWQSRACVAHLGLIPFPNQPAAAINARILPAG